MYFRFGLLTDRGGLYLYWRDEKFNHFQFHPEADAVEQLQGTDNADDFMDCETALLIFEVLIDSLYSS